jgi:beta-lactamase class A
VPTCGVPALEAIFGGAGCDGSLHAVRQSDGAEIGHDADRVQVSASVVKVPIAVEFHSQVDDGRIVPTQRVTLEPDRRTPGPVGISQFVDPVTVSMRDLAYLMLTVSDNAATDVLTAAVGVDAVNRRLASVGCRDTAVVGDLQALFDGVAADLGFDDYRDLVAAQNGSKGEAAQAAATDPDRIDRCRALDPHQTTRTTARDSTRLLTAIWSDRAASAAACAAVRDGMSHQVTRRFGAAVPEGGSLAAKSGSLFGRVRNEIGVITDRDGESYAVAVFTRAHRPFVATTAINRAMATAAASAIDELRR